MKRNFSWDCPCFLDVICFANYFKNTWEYRKDSGISEGQGYRKGSMQVMALQGDAAPVEFRNASGNGKAQTGSLSGMGAVPLIKFLKDTVLVPGRDFRAAVFDPDPDLFRSFLNGNLNGAPFRGEFYRVVQKIDPDLFQHFFIGGDGMLLKFQGQPQMFSGPLLFQQQNAGADLLREIKGRGAGKDFWFSIRV